MKFSLILSPTGRNLPKAETVRKVPVGVWKTQRPGQVQSYQAFYNIHFNFTRKKFGTSSKQDMQYI